MAKSTSAFSERRFRDMVTRFDNIAAKVTRHLSPLPGFTRNDFLNLVLEPEHRKVLQNAQNIVGPLRNYSTYIVEWPGKGHAQAKTVTFTFAPVLKFILPEYCERGPVRSAPVELVDRVEAWVQRRLEVGRQLGVAKETLNLLNRKCANPEQVRFMLPAILALIDPEETALRRALERAKTPSRYPVLPAGAREAIKITQDALAKAMLLPDEVKFDGEVQLAMHHLGKVLAPWQLAEGKDYFIDAI